MTLGSEVFPVLKKIFVVSEEVTRLPIETKELARTVQDHEVRLAVIENTLTLTRRSTNLNLPGK